MPTLLLVSPPVLFGTTWWRKHIASKPHLKSLAGFVRDVAEVRIADLDMAIDLSPQQCFDDEAVAAAIAGKLSLDGVDLVGISCWTSMHYLGAVAVARVVRRLDPEIPIVVGGHHPTAVPEDFSGPERLFDFVVRGDGEQVLRELCEQLPRRPAETAVRNGAPVEMSPHIDWDTYAPEGRGRELWLCLSRGCPFKCFFCAEPQRGTRWNRYEVPEALAIVDKLVARFEPRVICFSDPLFGANHRWCEQFLEGVRERRLRTLFWAETRADSITKRLLELFRDCRFKLDFGVDTGSERMASLMMKAPNPKTYLAKTRENLKAANAAGLAHGMFLVFNYPGETPETARETMAFADSIVDEGVATSGDLAGQTFFMLPGTEAYRRIGEYRLAHGTEIRHPRWWRERGDHHALATDLIPSAAFRGREGELTAFYEWQYRLNVVWTMRHTQEVQAFRSAFHAPSGGAEIRARDGS